MSRTVRDGDRHSSDDLERPHIIPSYVTAARTAGTFNGVVVCSSQKLFSTGYHQTEEVTQTSLL